MYIVHWGRNVARNVIIIGKNNLFLLRFRTARVFVLIVALVIINSVIIMVIFVLHVQLENIKFLLMLWAVLTIIVMIVLPEQSVLE